MQRELQALSQISATFLMKFPSGKFGFVGRVPVTLLYAEEEATIAKLLNSGCSQFLPRRAWATADDAIAAAREIGCEVVQ